MPLNKIIVFILLICPVFYSNNWIHAGEENKTTPQRMSAAKWVEDLDYLVKRLEFTHPNLYANISREDFIVSVDGLRRTCAEKKDVEIVLELIKLLALFKDGHTAVDPATGSELWINELFSSYPYSAYLFADGLFVTGAANRYSQMAGKKIVKIGDFETGAALKKLEKYVSADNQTGIISKLPILITIKELLEYEKIKDAAPVLKLTLEDASGARSEMELEAKPLMNVYPLLFRSAFPVASDNITVMTGDNKQPLPLWLRHMNDNYRFEILPDNKSLYLQINNMQEKKEENFAAFCSRMFKTIDEKRIEQLIIDIRLNTGGQHFEMPLLLGIIERPRLNKNGNLFLLTGRLTFSAAQHLTTLLSRYTNVIIMGEPTAGKPNHFGNPKKFPLINSGLGIRCSYVLHQDSHPEDYTITTLPDIYVFPNSTDFRNLKDPALEKVFTINSCQSMKQDFFKRMSEAYQRGGTAKLKEEYAAIKPGYIQAGFNIEKLLYNDLDGWVNAHRASDDDYINYLKFMREEIPDSMVINLDLGGWLKQRDPSGAISCFRKCLEINPACKAAKMELMLMRFTGK